MAEGTLIEWARHPVTGLGATWNIVTGCAVVSPGCTNCYAMKLAGTRLRNHVSRQGLTVQTKAGPVWNGETRFNEQWLTQPLAWKKPHGIFVAAHGDLFAEGVTDDQLDRIFAVMALTPQHVYYVLTKRPERMREYLDQFHGAQPPRDRVIAAMYQLGATFAAIRWPLPNVWLGVSVEDQTRADERIPILLETPAAIRFISAEPLLGPIDLRYLKQPNAGFGPYWLDALDRSQAGWFADESATQITNDSDVHDRFGILDWVIAGGESGPSARPSHPDWFRSLRDQCAGADVAFFFKQWGNWHEAATDWREADGSHIQADPENYEDCQLFDPATDKLITHDGRLFTPDNLPPDTPARLVERIGKKAAGRLLDGQEHSAFPQIRPYTGGPAA